MNTLDLPSILRLALLISVLASASSSAPSSTNTTTVSRPAAVPANGTGPAYASACSNAIVEYYSRSSSWTASHEWISNTTQILGGTTTTIATYYENATTLCDGHARVTYSPAVSLSTRTLIYPAPVTGTTTIVNTYFSDYPLSAPSCSIQPSDCDPLWSQYSSRTRSAATITPAPSLPTPPCLGVSAAASISSAETAIYGCGDCTIYGDGVQLVYFPTTVSRDMCASTPTARLTHYGQDAVITAFSGKNFTGGGDAGGNQTVVADGHTFTTGTAYISIATVWAEDRCSKTFGTPIKDAILAMPSESVLSLRYSQDHFQHFMSTDQVTGYPVSYADFNSPVPWSAWNGQTMCDPGGYGGWACSIIYENSYRPQLAIPPQITDLSPDFRGCQMWYNGLWDPPLALQQAQSVATPTLPAGYSSIIESAAPSSTALAPTVTPTAIADTASTTAAEVADSASHAQTSPNNGASPAPSYGAISSQAGLSQAAAQSALQATITSPAQATNPCTPESEPWVHSFDVDGTVIWATGADRKVKIGSITCTSGGPIETLADGTQATYGDEGLILKGISTVNFADGATTTTIGLGATPVATYILSGLSITAARSTAFVEIEGETKVAVQSSPGGPVVVDNTMTLVPGGPATTLKDGEILSAIKTGIVVDWTSTLGVTDETPSSSNALDEGANASQSTTRTATSGAASGTTDLLVGSQASSSVTASACKKVLDLRQILSVAVLGLLIGFGT